MSREVRRVPADWQHPTEEATLFERGRRVYRPVFIPLDEGELLALIGERERTHWQMFETTSEGTPISPPCSSPEALARWLVDNDATVFADMTATYEQWLTMITGSGATVGMALTPAGRVPGWLDGQTASR